MTKLLALLLLTTPLAADPWGKDADLATHACAKEECPPLFSSECCETLIQFHKQVISPADGPRSHYSPSSSSYTLEAMQAHGCFTGFLMGCDRLMRENNDPWVYRLTTDPYGDVIKWDPIP